MLGILALFSVGLSILSVTSSVLIVRASRKRKALGQFWTAIGLGFWTLGAALSFLAWQTGDSLGVASGALCLGFLALVVSAIIIDALVFRTVAMPKLMEHAPEQEAPQQSETITDDSARRGAGEDACFPVKKAEGGGQVPVVRTGGSTFLKSSLWGDTSWTLTLDVKSTNTSVKALATSVARERSFWTAQVGVYAAAAVATAAITCDKSGDGCVPDCTGGEQPSDNGPCSAAVLIKGTVQGQNLNVEVTCAASYTAHVSIKKVSLSGGGGVGAVSGSASIDIELPPGDAPKEKVVHNIKYRCATTPAM
jgi:hypothetical protein